MSKGTCTQRGCTVSDTGKCLLSHENPSDCPHFKVAAGESPAEGDDLHVVPVSTPNGRAFHSASALGVHDTEQLMRSRYARVVAILGLADVGKTAILSSMYLLASNRMLRDYSFAGSRSLIALESQARRARQWPPAGGLPERLTERTVLNGERAPAFIHLALRHRSRAVNSDLLLSDLPGEWSKRLIERADFAPAFAFLMRADAVLVVVDGQRLQSEPHVQVSKTSTLLRRVQAAGLLEPGIPVAVVVSKVDLFPDLTVAPAERLLSQLTLNGIAARVLFTAAFSSCPERVPHGHGIDDLLTFLTDQKPARPTEAPQLHQVPHDRCYLRSTWQ